MSVSKSMLKWFYSVALSKGNSSYQGFTLEFLSRLKEIRLLRGTKKLASWLIESDQIIEYTNNIETKDEYFVKKFHLLPEAADKQFQVLQQEAKTNESLKNEQNQKKSMKQNKLFLEELNDVCLQLKNNEINRESLNEIIRKFAGKYIDEWYIVGTHPDKYNDNYPMYFSAAYGKVKHSLLDIGDIRVSEFVYNNFDLNPNAKDSYLIKGMTNNEIIKYTRIFPVRAQREGNLVTITEDEHEAFNLLAKKALKFGEKLIKSNIKLYVPEKTIKVYWWEKNGDFFIDEKPDEPNTLREKIHKDLQPKPKYTPKPSRLKLMTKFVYRKKFTIREYSPQKGIINWRIRSNKAT